MTQEEKRLRIATACGTADRWVLKKRGLYYRPNAAGYTGNIGEAWIITKQEAEKHVYPHDEPVTMHPAPVVDYFGDLNSCHEMEKHLTEEQLRGYWSNLWLVVKPKTAIHLLCYATADQRAEAFGLTLNLWEAGQ